MSFEQVAERYGRAIFELGLETGELSALNQQLHSMAQTYRASSDLRAVVDDPIAGEKERAQLVDELASRLGFSTLSKNAVQLLAQRRRLAALPEIVAKLSRLTDEHNKVVRVVVTSAEPLSEAYSQELVQKLEQSTGKRILMEKKVDSSLIAGVITTIGDNTIDGSLSGRLRQMQQQLFDL